MPRNTTLVTWSSRCKVNVFSFWLESASGLSLISLKFVSNGLQSTWLWSHRSKRSLHDIPPHILKFAKGNLPAVFLRVSILALGCFSKNVAMAIAFSLLLPVFSAGWDRSRDGSLNDSNLCEVEMNHQSVKVGALGSIWNSIRIDGPISIAQFMQLFQTSSPEMSAAKSQIPRTGFRPDQFYGRHCRHCIF